MQLMSFAMCWCCRYNIITILLLRRWHLISSCIYGIVTETLAQISKCCPRNMQSSKNIRPLIRKAK